MSTTTYTYPAFDHLEVNLETEFGNTSYQKLQPVKTGDTVNTNSGVPASLGNSYADVPVLSKIMVVYFYSKHWGEVGLEHLKQLNAIRNEVKYQDGSIVIVDADGNDSDLQQVLWNNDLILPVHTDHNARIATAFKVYSENSPTWDRYAGIDHNVPLPAFFVVDHFFNVVFDHHNEDIFNTVPTDQILRTVYRSNNYLAGRRSA